MLFNPVLAGLTVRQALAKRRWIIVLLLAAAPIVMATLIRLHGTVDDESLQILAVPIMTLIFTVIVPVIGLVLAASSFGAEIEDGTVIYLLAKPISRAEIVVTKLVVTAIICITLAAVTTLGAGMSLVGGLDPTGLVLGLTAGAALGAFLYTVLFLALGLVTKRGMLVGLTYLVVWEGALGSFFQGTRVLSVRQYMLAITDAISTVSPEIFAAPLPAKTAYIMSAVVAVATVTLCIRTLRTFEIGHAA